VNCSDQRAFIDPEPAMSRLILPFCMLAALGMAGCTTHYDPPPTTPVATTGGVPVVSASSKATSGVIQTISLASQANASASAGGTSASAASGPYRMTLRMDDGSLQTLVVDNRAFLVGDRVQVTPEGRMIRQQ